VFIVQLKATKPQIKEAVERMYNIRCRGVNTLITAFISSVLLILFLICPSGQKKAFIRLCPDYEALDVANQIGIC
jgi:large subunit ribosomal protein L23Ae